MLETLSKLSPLIMWMKCLLSLTSAQWAKRNNPKIVRCVLAVNNASPEGGMTFVCFTEVTE